MTQKVLRIGSSAAVTIPKKSLKDLGIKIGDEVEVIVNKNQKRVSITPFFELSPEDKKIAELTFRFIKHYRKDLETLARK